MDTGACRSPTFEGRADGDLWRRYVEENQACEDELWRDFVTVAGLVRDLIHHMEYQVMRHDGVAHGRSDEIRRLLGR